MKEYAILYHFYRTFFLRVIRILILFLLLSWIFGFFLLLVETSSQLEFYKAWPLKIPLFLLSLFLIFEIFFRFKVSRIVPFLSVPENNGKDIYLSFTLQIIELFLTKSSTEEIIKTILKKEEVNFILNKCDIEEKEIIFTGITKENLAAFAFSLSKNVNGRFVTTLDVFASFILLSEPKTKLLFSKNIKKEHFLYILHWAHLNYPNEENPKPKRVEFWGEGFGESWVHGWTLETSKYTIDLTPRVLREKQILAGRKEEYVKSIEVINKAENNNLLLIGETGTGKTSLVKTLAAESYAGILSGRLYHKRFFELLVDSLLAGANNQGELELRLQSIIAEISHSGNVIIYIPEFQNILGATSFKLDLSGAIMPYLKNGTIQIIATSTTGNYKTYIEPMNNIMSFFEVIKLEEPNEKERLEMLLEKALAIETKNKVSLTYKAIVAASKYGNKYIPDKSYPGCAVDLLNISASSIYLKGQRKVEEEDVLKTIEEKSNIKVSVPNSEEKKLLLNLEGKMHERVIDQREGISAIAQALRRIRTGLSSQNKPISFLFLGPTGVGKTETAKTLASIYFKDENRMIRLDMSEYNTADGVKRLLGSPPGEGSEKGELTEKIYENPFSLVLLDEFEKASSQIHDLFLQILDDGRLTDNKGRTVSFADAIIIATSNAGSEFIREEIQKGTSMDKAFQQRLLDLLQSKGIFKPELLNRFDEVIAFKPLSFEDSKEIIKLMLSNLSKKLLEQDITFSFDEKIIEKIVREGTNNEFGARPLRRFIQDNIEDLISQKLLKDEIKRGDKILISVDESNNIMVSSGVIPAKEVIQ